MSEIYRIEWFCPHCDNPGETIEALIPRPRRCCSSCLINHVEVVEMVIERAEPMVNLIVTGPNGESLAD